MNTENKLDICGQEIKAMLAKGYAGDSVITDLPFIYFDVFILLSSNKIFNLSKVCENATAIHFDEISSICIESILPPSDAHEIQDPLLLEHVIGKQIIGFVKSKFLTLTVGILVDSNRILTMDIGETIFTHGVWHSEDILEFTPIDAFFA